MKFILSILFLGSMWAYAGNEASILDSHLLLAYSNTQSRTLNSYLMTAYKPHSKKSVSSKNLHYSPSESSSNFSSGLTFRYIQVYHEELISPLFQMEFIGGWDYSLSPRVDVNVKIASGGWYSQDYNNVSFSGAKSFIGGVGGKPIWLQGVSLSYAFKEDFSLHVGKFSSSPFYNKEQYNILWDEHIAPEGIYGYYHRDFFDRYSINVKLSGLFIDSVSPLITGYGAALLPDLSRVDPSDSLSPSSQKLINSSNRLMAALSTDFLMEDTDYAFGLSAVYYDMSTKDMFVSGNTTNSILEASDKQTFRYKYDYSVLDFTVKMNIKNLNGGKFIRLTAPLSLYLQLIQNFGSGHAESTALDTLGFVVGGVLGRRQYGSPFTFSYHYFRLPTDATFSHYIDRDIGGTGFAGHRFSVKYFLNDDVSVGLKYTLRGKQPPTTLDKVDHFAFADISIRI